MRTYYDVLEVSEKASSEVIKRAYKVLIKKYHPDMNIENSREAEEKTKELSIAYNILSDEVKRKQYDLSLQALRDSEKKESPISNKNDEIFDENKAKEVEDDILINKANQELNRRINEKVREANIKIQEEQEKIIENLNRKKAERLRELGYEVYTEGEKKERFNRNLKIFIISIIIFIILVIIYKVPFLNNLLLKLEEKNVFIKIISEILRRIVMAICKVFFKF